MGILRLLKHHLLARVFCEASAALPGTSDATKSWFAPKRRATPRRSLRHWLDGHHLKGVKLTIMVADRYVFAG
jgi:hypothetical protein